MYNFLFAPSVVACYALRMNPPKEKRNKRIVKLKDIDNLSFSEIGVKEGITKQTAHAIYTREKEKISTP